MGKIQENDFLIDVLKELDFFSPDLSVENNYPEIIFTKNIPSNLHPKHYIALEFAEILEADAVYFKYYDDHRFCVPQVYFYDNELNTRDNYEIEEIHKRVYSSCQVPLICIIDKISITIRDCREPIKNIRNGKIIENKKAIINNTFIENIDSLKSYFSAKKLNFSFFWEETKIENHFTNNHSAYEKLVKVLTKIREDFINNCINSGISKDIANDLLFKCILIKYLEENGKNQKNAENFARDFYHKNNLNLESLKEILNNNKLVELLEYLEKHFNGGVFKISSQKEKDFIQEKINLKFLAECLEGNLDVNSQLTIWQIYSFKDIPIELISNFYEEFISKEIDLEKGTVYTPSLLVNLLIDETIPILLDKNKNEYNLKIIDVSCGSGIFISTAFKRLVQRYRIKESRNNKPIPKENLKLDIIKKILSENIFGVDQNESATKLTNFSLQLALCQIVPNNKLWNWTKGEVFDDLKNNIICNDFFKFIIDKDYTFQHHTFDLVIGNPPFIKYTKEKSEELQSIEKELIKNNIDISTGLNEKNQIALTFLDAMMMLTKPEIGKICQIIPSGELLFFQDSFKFRNYFFRKYNISQIFDFTLLRRSLFSESSDTTVPVVTIFAENKKPTEENILHITFRRTKESQKKLNFELDYYDFYEVSKEIALNNVFCWKANLYGGKRILSVLNKHYLNSELKIKDFLKKNGISTSEKKKYSIKFQKSLLDGDFPIIKNKIGEGINLFSDEKITINNFLNEYLLDENIKKINNFFIAITSGRQGLRGAYTINDSDFINTPYFEEKPSLMISDKIIINDVVNYRIAEFGRGERAEINSIIPIEDIQKLNCSVNPLFEFATIFNQSFNSIYKKGDCQQQLRKIYAGSDFYGLEFYYSSDKIKTELIENADLEIETLIKNVSNNIIVSRIFKIYGENSITFIKPKNLRYWLKSIALRDADDVFDDMIKNGY